MKAWLAYREAESALVLGTEDRGHKYADWKKRRQGSGHSPETLEAVLPLWVAYLFRLCVICISLGGHLLHKIKVLAEHFCRF